MRLTCGNKESQRVCPACETNAVLCIYALPCMAMQPALAGSIGPLTCGYVFIAQVTVTCHCRRSCINGGLQASDLRLCVHNGLIVYLSDGH